MPDLATSLLAATLTGVVAYVARREHRALLGARRNLLDASAAALERPTIVQGADGFPRLSGAKHGRQVEVALIPDTLTIRRLPQLWLAVSLVERTPGLPGFSVLVRPTGNEFYALSSEFPERLEPPPGLPREILIRGEAGASQVVERLAAGLGKLLADPAVKEIAVTAKGARLVRQAGEGRRGEHLILRQAVFEGVDISAASLDGNLRDLSALLSSAAPRERTCAA